MSLKTKVTIIITTFSIIAFFIVVTVLSVSNYSQRHFESNGHSSLSKVLEINELHTLEYRYNSYAVVYATRYNMEIYDTYKDIMQSLSQEYTAEKKASAISFESFRQEKLDLLASTDENSSLIDFLTLCVTQEDYDNLKDFLSLSRKHAVKLISTQKYAVAYEGIITAGINKPISFSIDKENHLVTVEVPRAEIIDINVNIPADTENKSVIYTEKRYVNTDKWNKEALSACRADLQQKITTDMEFLNIATENARDAIIALLRPFENQSGYEFKVTLSC